MATHISFNRLNINDRDQLDGYLHGYISKHWNALRPRVYWLQRTFTAILRREDQSESILAAAEQTGADLIVIGHRGLSWMEGMLVGSTPERVAGIANTPVLIVQQDTTRSA
jgi:hypothetical protein